MPTTTQTDCDRSRDLRFFTTPALWGCWPYLPLMRRNGGKEECGLLCDVFGLTGTTGFSATVVVCNLFLVPPDLDDFLALPKEVFDTPGGGLRRWLARRLKFHPPIESEVIHDRTVPRTGTAVPGRGA